MEKLFTMMGLFTMANLEWIFLSMEKVNILLSNLHFLKDLLSKIKQFHILKEFGKRIHHKKGKFILSLILKYMMDHWMIGQLQEKGWDNIKMGLIKVNMMEYV